MIHPPPPLSREEFRRRWHRLRAEGKPVTMRSIDPDLAAWMEARQQTRLGYLIGLGVVVLVVVAVIIIAVI